MEKVVTVVGATGTLGLKIVNELVKQHVHVKALVRPTSDRTKLQELGVTDFIVGDMLDPGSLTRALSSEPKADALISGAAGYTGHAKGDTPKTDTEGYRNLIEAAKAAGIPRFVLISILECDKAQAVPHFYHKYLAERYLSELGQPFIALRAGAFLDQTRDFVLPQLAKGIFPVFIPGVEYGMIYTPDLARYAAHAATTLPTNALNAVVDVGWERPASGDLLAEAFTKLLGKKITVRPSFPPFMANVMFPFFALFNPGLKDMSAMMKWIKKGSYTSKNTARQKELFGDLPSIEEAAGRYCRDRKLI